ncbi:MAG: hypothetical protein JNL19_07660 [Burkholderiales bacterium]|nr:hypothetical protein [Burkholderiales bacterium]
MNCRALNGGAFVQLSRLAAFRLPMRVNVVASIGFALAAACVSVGHVNAQSASATEAPVKSEAPFVEKTSDGRAFSSLSEKDVDALPRSEKRAYYAWKNAALDGELARVTAENAELDKVLARVTAENAELDKVLARVTAENAAIKAKQLQVVAAKWAQVAVPLQRMSPERVMEYLNTDRAAHIRLLAFVVENKIEPRAYAQNLLDALRTRELKK